MRLIDADKLKQADFQDFSNTDVFNAIDNEPTVNAVVLPCNAGDTSLTSCEICNGITKWTQFLNGNQPNVEFNFCPVCGRYLKGGAE